LSVSVSCFFSWACQRVVAPLLNSNAIY
jgi:hypothetical protein